jgi:5,10-methylene-tetrahydrofolate dehydrogenase/methenyl tetrahydrofolate cyclohydrolase
MVRRDWVKPGAVVIDVGTNKFPIARKSSGFSGTTKRLKISKRGYLGW